MPNRGLLSNLWFNHRVKLKKLANILILFSLILLVQSNVSALGVDPFGESTISIYPNPVVYEANISLDKDIDLNVNEVSLYFFNVVGEMVHEVENIQYHNFRVSKDHFKRSGIYLFQLKMDGEVLKTGKINIH